MQSTISNTCCLNKVIIRASSRSNRFGGGSKKIKFSSPESGNKRESRVRAGKGIDKWRPTVSAPRALQSLTPQSTKKRGRSLLRFGHRNVGSGRPMTAAQQFTFPVHRFHMHALPLSLRVLVTFACECWSRTKKPASVGHVQKEGYPK